MASIAWRRFLGVALIVSITLACLVRLEMLQIQRMRAKSEAARPFGLYTQRQILERSEALCHRIDPRAGHLVYSVEPQEDVTREPLWSVEGREDTTNCVVSLIWDAKTGDLRSIGRLLPRTGLPRLPVTDRRHAQRIAWQWLCTLGLDTAQEHWRPASVSPQACGHWAVRWRSEGRIVCISLDDTGDLVMASTWLTHTTLT